MLYTRPTLEEARALVDAALRVRQAAPWLKLREDQIFAVCDPIIGETSYVSVTGRGGMLPTVSAFPGYVGHVSLSRLMYGPRLGTGDEELLWMKVRTCVFIPYAELSASDRRFLTATGQRFRRGELAPRFTSLEPGCVPWAVSSEEARMLTVVLDQTIEVASDLEQDPDLLLDPPGYALRTRRLIGGEPPVWSFDWRPIDSYRGTSRKPAAVDDLTIARLQRLPFEADAEWEVAAVTGPGAIRETSNHRPEIMLALLVVHRGSGFVLCADVKPAPRLLAELAGCITKGVLAVGVRPRRILVKDTDVRDHLAPLAAVIGSKLLRVHSLPALESAQADLARQFAPAPMT